MFFCFLCFEFRTGGTQASWLVGLPGIDQSFHYIRFEAEHQLINLLLCSLFSMFTIGIPAADEYKRIIYIHISIIRDNMNNNVH